MSTEAKNDPEGTPEDVAEVDESATGQFLRSILAERTAAAA